jgi:hypothetical protein
MALWGNTDTSANAPKYKGVLAHPREYGSAVRGNTAFNNTNVSEFQLGTTFGVFGVDANETANYAAGGPGGIHSGWVTVKYGTGPIASITVSGGTNFANGETVRFAPDNGDTAVFTLTTNSTSKLVSATVTAGGSGFVNVGSIDDDWFTREKHLSNGSGITVTGGSGYHNTNYIVASNGTINATATFTTNSTGGFQNNTIQVTNVGLWANTKTNGHVNFTVYAANGAASNGSSASLAAVLSTSSDGSVDNITFGGRAGRVYSETLVAMSGKTFSTETDSEDNVFPDGP